MEVRWDSEVGGGGGDNLGMFVRVSAVSETVWLDWVTYSPSHWCGCRVCLPGMGEVALSVQVWGLGHPKATGTANERQRRAQRPVRPPPSLPWGSPRLSTLGHWHLSSLCGRQRGVWREKLISGQSLSLHSALPMASLRPSALGFMGSEPV